MAKHAPPKPNDTAAVEAASQTPESKAAAEEAKITAKDLKIKVKLLGNLSKGELVKALAANVTISEAQAMQAASLGI